MREGWREVTLGELVKKRDDFSQVEPDDEYVILGVQRSGWGFVEREPIRGRNQKFTKLMKIERDDLVYRTITAFEAPSSVAGSKEAGLFVTPQTFPVFRIDTSRLLPAYMRLLTTWPMFHEDMAVRCTGTVLRRKTLSAKAFQSIPIQLPPLDEQRRIIDLIGSVDDAIEAAELYNERNGELGRALRDFVFRQAASNNRLAPAGELFDMLLGRQKSAAQSVGDHVIPYLRAANIGDGEFDLSDLKQMNFDPAEQTKYSLQKDDVALVEGGSIGLSARWDDMVQGPVGFDKHVIRLRARASESTPEYILQWSKWAYESGQFAEQATGITIKALGFGRARSMLVPVVSLEEQESFTAPLAAVDSALLRGRALVSYLRTLRSNLLTALLSGEHEIPASYDELLEETAA